MRPILLLLFHPTSTQRLRNKIQFHYQQVLHKDQGSWETITENSITWLINTSTNPVCTHKHAFTPLPSTTTFFPHAPFFFSPISTSTLLQSPLVAISICSNEIYLASGECPSAMRDNISYKYQPSNPGSCNIYTGTVAVGDVNSVYRGAGWTFLHSAAATLPTFWQAELLRLIFLLPSNFTAADLITSGILVQLNNHV